MRKIVTLPVAEILPDRSAVLANQGIPPQSNLSGRIEELIARAQSLFRETANPRGALRSISVAEFEKVYYGQGLNEPVTPVADIFPKASHLALFALTVGSQVSTKIDRLFNLADFALASMLDATAAAAADKAAAWMESYCLKTLVKHGQVPPDTTMLCYSPGYCGWHISGQTRLFEYLRPEQAGVTLRESCLMEPLKSVSGVLIAGPAEIHQFIDIYPFCSECQDHSCRFREPVILRD